MAFSGIYQGVYGFCENEHAGTVLFWVLCLLMLCVTAQAEEGTMRTVFFGSFTQQGSEADPIEWIVLDEADGKTLLLAKDCLASLPWHNAHMAVTWDKSDLRAWLNGEFLQTAFTAEEQGRILLTDLDNSDVLGYGTPVGADTRDQVFLLSGTEGKLYLTDAIRNIEEDQVCFCFNSAVSPSIIRPKETRKSVYLVLPVRTF